MPVTSGEFITVAKGLFKPGFSLKPSRFELTFDLKDIPFDEISRFAFTNARKKLFYGEIANGCVESGNDLIWEDEDDESEWTKENSRSSNTWYFGSTKSSKEICIYDKVNGVVRIEFVLRRAFLRDHDINQLHHILQLGTLDLSRSLTFKEFQPERFRARIDKLKLPGTWTHEIYSDWTGCVQDLERLLRTRRVQTQGMLRPHPLSDVITGMQRNLVW